MVLHCYYLPDLSIGSYADVSRLVRAAGWGDSICFCCVRCVFDLRCGALEVGDMSGGDLNLYFRVDDAIEKIRENIY